MSRSQEQTQNQNQPQFEITGDELHGYEAKLATGQVYKGKTQAELLNSVVQAQLNSSMTLQQKEQQLAETRRVLDQQAREKEQLERQHNQNQGQEQGLTREQFNQRYWELVNTDPWAAQEYANQVYWGHENPRAVLGKSAVVSEFVSDAVATREFMNDNLDFPASPENGERIINEVLDRGLDITSGNLERVWKDMKKSGQMQALTQEQIQQEQAQIQSQGGQSGMGMGGALNQRRQAPPNAGGQGSSDLSMEMSNDAIDKFSTMTHAQKQQYLREQGLL